MSHLKHFGVANFKVFNEMTRFKLAPITILTGKNNSGKSSLIKSLQLLRNNNEIGEHSLEQLKFDRSEFKLGSLDEIFNFENNGKSITLEFSINNVIFPNGKIALTYNLDYEKEVLNLRAFSILCDDQTIAEFDQNLLCNIPYKELMTHYIKLDYQFFLNGIERLDYSKLIIANSNAGLVNSKQDMPRETISQLFELLKAKIAILGYRILSPRTHSMEDNKSLGFVLSEDDYEKINVSNEDLLKIQRNLFERFNDGFTFEQDLTTFGCIDSFLEFLEFSFQLENIISELFNQDDALKKRTLDAYKGKILCNKDGQIMLKPILHPFFTDTKIIFQNLFKELQKELVNFTYLPSIRARNDRLYQVSKEGYALQAIDQKAFEKIDFNNEKLSKYFKNALRDFDIGENIEIRTYQRSATEITIVRGEKRILLSDLGFGYAQLVPIILNIVIIASENWGWKFSKKESDFESIPYAKILIEEPESNLHPDFQSKLADLFVNASNLFGIQFIIETHSEYLIRRLQYLTAKKNIKPEDISIYYFNNPNKIPDGEKQINKIEIRSDGSLTQDFGSGFFDEASNWKFELMRIKHEQKN